VNPQYEYLTSHTICGDVGKNGTKKLPSSRGRGSCPSPVLRRYATEHPAFSSRPKLDPSTSDSNQPRPLPSVHLFHTKHSLSFFSFTPLTPVRTRSHKRELKRITEADTYAGQVPFKPTKSSNGCIPIWSMLHSNKMK